MKTYSYIVFNRKWSTIIVATFFISINLFSQNKSEADSLISVYHSNDYNDSLQYDLLENICFNLVNPREQVKYSNIIIDLAKSENNYSKLYVGHYAKGSAYKLMGDLDSAAHSFFNSINFAHKAEYEGGIGRAYAALGDLYANGNNHSNSVKYYNKGIEIFRRTDESVALASTLLNLGYEYYLSAEYDSAMLHYSESKDLFDQVGYPIGIAYNQGNMGLVLAKEGSLIEAEKEITQAIDLLKTFQDSYAITEYELEMASIYQSKAKYEQAINFASNAFELATVDGLKKRVRDASLKLSELYQATGEYQKAYTYQSQYIAYRDSINNEETIRKMADLRTEYEVGQKQAEVDLANTEKEAQAKQALIVGGGLSVVLLLIGVIAFIQYRNNQQKKATNQILRHQKGELETQKTQLEALNSTKDRFFSIISHDLRGPVNAFFGVSKLIKMYVSKGKVNEITEIAEDIDESVSKLSGLLDNLLDWAVQQQGQFPNVPEKVNFNEMTNDLIQVFDTMAKSKNIELINDLPDKVELFVDKNSTMTIFRNLLNNALKFTEEGGSVTFHGELDKETAILKVTDTGVGIPADKLKELFTLNEKKSTWGTAGEKGLGLGLQLAYEFAEMNKGVIEVESEEGFGTTFIVKLPVFETEDVKSE